MTAKRVYKTELGKADCELPVIKLLIIEDQKADQILLQTYLQTEITAHYEIDFAQCLKEARRLINLETYDAILTDFYLPDGTGPEFIKENQNNVTTPFVVLTGRIDKTIEEEVLSSGASDFIPKSELSASLLKRVIKFTIERNRTQALLREKTIRDPLTGLYNRLGMENLLAKALKNSKQSQKPFSLLLIDIDKFKTINDTFGHSIGDEVLKIVAESLESSTRCSQKKDFAIRIGGDEFALIATDLDEIDNVHLIIDRLSKRLSTAFEIEGYEISVALSIGVAVYPSDGNTRDELINNADFSLYRAKRKSGMTFEFFDKGQHEKIQKRNFIENSLNEAIRKEQFLLYYQPKIQTRTGNVKGCEALIRWDHPDKGIIWPREFIHVTEETGHILEIGTWVLWQACHQAVAWQKLTRTPFSISVNVSIRQLLHSSFLDTIKTILKETGLNPKHLELEITESMVIQNLNRSIKILRKLRNMGIVISLDDFGTGYSSLSRLRLLPIDKLKIDRFLIRKVGKNRFDTAITRTVLSLAKNLKITAIAEGVETEDQYRFLKNAGCPEIQGYYFSKPVPPFEFEEYFQRLAA